MRPNFLLTVNMNIKNLRILAMLEGSSLILLLFIAMPMKYYFGIPEATKVVGMIHGILFLSFVSMLMAVVAKGLLEEKYSLVGTVAAFIPFGTWIFEHKVLKPRVIAK